MRCLLLLLLLLQAAACSCSPLLVLLLDGLRWDYPLDDTLPNFRRLRAKGATVSKLQPVYPTLCLPNIFSMFTGAYPHRHGVDAGRLVFDPALNSSLDVRLATRVPPLWEAVPSRLYFLPGVCPSSTTSSSSSSSSSPSSSSCARRYRRLSPLRLLRSGLAEAVSLLAAGDTKLAVVYCDLLDWTAHRYGPQAFALRRRAVRQVDVLLGNAMRLLSSVADAHLLVVGDHGAASVDKFRKSSASQFFTSTDVDAVQQMGASVAVWPRAGRWRSVWQMASLHQQSHPMVELLTAEQLRARFYSRPRQHRQQREKEKKEKKEAENPLAPLTLLAADGHFVEAGARFPQFGSGAAAGWHGHSPRLSAMRTTALLLGPRARPGAVVVVEGGEESDEWDVRDLHELMLQLLQPERLRRQRARSLSASVLRQHRQHQWRPPSSPLRQHRQHQWRPPSSPIVAEATASASASASESEFSVACCLFVFAFATL